MKKERLFELLGEADEQAVTAAMTPPKKSGTSAKRLAFAAAACIVLIAGAVFLRQQFNGIIVENLPAGSEEQYSSQADTAVAQGDTEIYYVQNGEVVSATEYLSWEPQEVFAAWKRRNSIADDVRLISVSITDNGTDTESGGVAAHTAGDRTVMTVTVSRELREYFDGEGGDLLEQSLQKTMTGYGDPNFTPDEYRLVYDN